MPLLSLLDLQLKTSLTLYIFWLAVKRMDLRFSCIICKGYWRPAKKRGSFGSAEKWDDLDLAN